MLSQVEQVIDSCLGGYESLGRQEYINHLTILIHGPPKIMLLAVDLYEDFIDIEIIAIASVFSLQSSGVYSVAFDAPEADRLAADGNTPLSE